jgi:hypothetical protein
MTGIGKQTETVSIVTVTLCRPSLQAACGSVERQSYANWHHYVIGDGRPPPDSGHPNRTSFGFSFPLGSSEPGLNMPDGTPNPLQRWALDHLELGDYVCFLDDDNLYREDFLMKMVAALDRDMTAGIALCAVEDRRYGQRIDGYPELGRCDNSGFVARRQAAKSVPFPKASPMREVVQDVEFISILAGRFGWTRVAEPLVVFGAAPDLPPRRGGLKVTTSWEGPIRAARRAKEGTQPESLRELEAFVADDPTDLWALWQLAEVVFWRGDRDRARALWSDWLARAAAVATPHPLVLLDKALAGLATGHNGWRADLQVALGLVEAQICAAPDDGEALLNRAVMRFLAHSPPEGLRDVERALEQRLRPEEACNSLGVLALISALGVSGPEMEAASALLKSTQ